MEGFDSKYYDNPTHPTCLEFAYTNWTDFQQDLMNAYESAVSQTPFQYTKVHVLLLSWLDDDVDTDQELQQLTEQWRTQFNFTTEIWWLPSEQPGYALDCKIGKVEANLRGEGSLLIVYYGGHAWHDWLYGSIWAANSRPDSPKFVWSHIEANLKRGPSDILILLDCCYAEHADQHPFHNSQEGATELIAACAMEAVANRGTKYSFTRTLMEQLQSFGSEPFTVTQLYERILNSETHSRNKSQYVPLTGRGRPSICIAPIASRLLEMVPSSGSTSSQGSSCSSMTSRSTATSATTSTSALPLAESRRVLLAVSLEDQPTPSNTELWATWLASDALPGFQELAPHVTLEEAFAGTPTLILVSIPTSVWFHMPDTSAYRFISFITGDGLLKQSDTPTTTITSYYDNVETELTPRKKHFFEGVQ